MQKGMMITGIVDACGLINTIFTRVVQKVKEGGLFSELENAFIIKSFTDIVKEGNQYIEKVKDLLTPKDGVDEAQVTALLQDMYTTMRGYEQRVKRIEKAFEKLAFARSSRKDDVEDVKKIFGVPAKGKK